MREFFKPKLFVGAMSKNVIDSVIEYTQEENCYLGLIPSRRQIEYNGGYVDNLTTKDFCDFVRRKTDKILLVRDHAGPSQGYIEDDGITSFIEDCKPNMFDVVHVDVWKKYPDYLDGLYATIDFINSGYTENENMMYEIGTEEAIRPFTSRELDNLIVDLKELLPSKIYKQITYLVIQSGTALLGSQNVGNYNQSRLTEMLDVARKHNLIAKEHNGDYIPFDIMRDKFKTGLDCINVAPELGRVETEYYIQIINQINPSLMENFYQICYDSDRWRKWVSPNFKPEQNKIELIKICGHYVFSNPDFILLKNSLNDELIDIHVKRSIKARISLLLSLMQ